MTEPAVIVADAVDAPNLGAAAADAPASPATKRKERATAIIKATADRQEHDFVAPFAQTRTRAFDLFLFGDSFLLCFLWTGPLRANGFGKTFWSM